MKKASRLLIADDNEMSLDILATYLRSQGYEVLSATDGETAMSLYRKERPDLVLLDVMMPGMDGVEVCRRIKNASAFEFIPVIMVTAKVDAKDIVHGLNAGADEYLTKPVDHQALSARVNSMLRMKELYDKNQLQATQLEKQAAQLQERNQDLTIQLLHESKVAEIAKLTADIAHDLKNMMMPIVTGVELIQEEIREVFSKLPEASTREIVASEKFVSEITDMVRRNTRRIQDRVKEVGDAVKGRITPPNFSNCEISKLVTDVIESLTAYAIEKKVTLHSKNLEKIPTIKADGSRLFNAIYNLVNNAIPETPEGGAVTVSGECSFQAKSILLSVSDTGRGMSQEILERLFTQKAFSTKIGGTGLGIKIVKDVVDAHGGTICVDSKKDLGTTFTLTLPLQQ